ncbi:hypothetical protein Dimus_007302, partial [Dionaea muscipula]
MFSSFGVVKDAFIPQKKTAEVAIQKTNGTWIKDKELKVKVADFARKNERKSIGRDRFVENKKDWQDANQHWNNVRVSAGNGSPEHRTSARPVVKQFSSKAQPQRWSFQSRNGKGRISYADVVNRGRIQNEEVSMVKGVGYSNWWLHRSAVTLFGDHRSPDYLLANYMQQGEEDTFVRRMGNKQVLLTFNTEEKMKQFIENHHKNSSPWFSSVCSWSINAGGSFGREIWLCCYGIPSHAWNFSTFHTIGQHWGEMVQIEEDTVKTTRLDVGKVKIFTTIPAVINHHMNLTVGSLSFDIRVSEEQAVLICITDFRCQCFCHVGDSYRNNSGRSSSDTESIDNAAANKEDNLAIMCITDHEHAGIPPNQVADKPTRVFDNDISETNQARILREASVEKETQDRFIVDRSNTSSSSINGSHYESRQSVGCEGTSSSLNGGVFLESGIREPSEEHNEAAKVDVVQETPEWGE